MINIIAGTPENLVIAIGHGKITADDYEKVLIPAIEEKLYSHKKIRLLYQLADDFHGFSAGAIWDDAKIGLGHTTEFEAIAVVTDVHWIIKTVEFFSFFMRCPVKAFRNEQMSEAMDWVANTTWMSMAEA
jgi:hypothetical protein